VRYDDQKHLDNLKDHGTYPKIHDAIFAEVEKYAIGETMMEVGACLGLISSRILKAGIATEMIAIEPNIKSLKRAVKEEGIKYFNLPVSIETMARIYKIMQTYKPTTIVARRTVSEIAEYGGGKRGVRLFGKAASLAGVERIILEGRVITKNHTAILWNADLEAEAFLPFYKVVHAAGDVRTLEKSEGGETK
jgi:hypothetical protein